MQTILGANGIIGEGLAKELFLNYTKGIRIVGRNPSKINETDQLLKADLLNLEQTKKAVEGSEIVYLTVGLPYSSEIMMAKWPPILQNVVDACIHYQKKLVYFDNTYMYDQGTSLQTEESPFKPSGQKGVSKEIAVNIVLDAIKNRGLEASICRAPEFYGPGKTRGITNTLIFDRIKEKKKARVFLTDQTKRTLIYTPDASRAMALIGHTSDAYGQTWHLPCDDNRLNYKEFMSLTSELYGKELAYSVQPKWLLNLVSLFNPMLKESKELFPRYEVDNIFDSSKFKQRFPEFKVTSYQEGIRYILKEMS